MKKAAVKPKTAHMSDAAVQAKTGNTWPEWFAILDAAGARNMNHQQIVAVLSAQHDVGPWWQQMVAVGYEQDRGLREKHQKPEGYEISVSRTIAVPVAGLYKAWHDAKARDRWLPESGLVIRKATENKTLRITWVDGKTSVVVAFAAKGDAKSQAVVQHSKLKDAKAAAALKKYWAGKLDRLQEMLEA